MFDVRLFEISVRNKYEGGYTIFINPLYVVSLIESDLEDADYCVLLSTGKEYHFRVTDTEGQEMVDFLLKKSP